MFSSRAALPENDEDVDVGEPPQHQYQPVSVVEEVVYVDDAGGARVEQILDQIQKHLAEDNTPDVHMGHALGQRMQNITRIRRTSCRKA